MYAPGNGKRMKIGDRVVWSAPRSGGGILPLPVPAIVVDVRSNRARILVEKRCGRQVRLWVRMDRLTEWGTEGNQHD